MKSNDKKHAVVQPNVGEPVIDTLDVMNTASSSEATGMMYCPPRNEDEMRSDEQLFSLQVEMPPEGCIDRECRWTNGEAAYVCGKGGAAAERSKIVD